jgi:aerobic carbon-monoxide dehydrogenase large subunit
MIGQRIRRREDPRFLTGTGRFVDDLQLPGALHAIGSCCRWCWDWGP